MHVFYNLGTDLAAIWKKIVCALDGVCFCLKTEMKNKIDTYLENSSMLKNTYSPDETMLSSSAASIISRTVFGLAQTTTTVDNL